MITDFKKDSFYNIRKTAFFIEITPKDRDCPRIKERITLRLASRDLVCKECDDYIEKGSKYIRDKFWEATDDFFSQIRKHTNFVCLKCWRGDIPITIAGNWIKD
jgi:hypothetical protein